MRVITGKNVLLVMLGLVLLVVLSVTAFGEAEKIITVGLNIDPVTLSGLNNTNADQQSVWTHILEQLVYFSADGSEILPGLVTSWEWIDDVTLELRLREGVSFTNGEPFDAESAVYSITQHFESPSYAFMLAEGLEADLEIVDDYTVRVHLNMPYSPFLSFLARSAAALPPKHHAEVGDDDFGLDPVGTGPYILERWVKGSQIELARNPDYWGEAPPADRIIFKIIPEDAARVAAIETGEVDIALYIPAAAIERLEKVSGVEVVTGRGARKMALLFDVKPWEKQNPLQDRRVRIALNLAVDKVSIVEQALSGTAEALPGQWFMPWEFGYNPDIEMFPYDPEKARALLAEAGYADGFDLKLTYTVGRYAQDKEIGELVSSYLEQVGVRVEQQPLEIGAFVKLWFADDLGPHQWAPLFPSDPHFALNYLLVSGITHATTVVADDPVITGLVLLGTMETNRDRRARIYHELAVKMHEDPWLVYLYVTKDIYATRSNVKNVVPRVDQVLSLYNVDID